MKTTIKLFQIKTLLMLLIFSSLCFVSCSEDEDEIRPTNTVVNDEEFSEILESSFVEEGGIITDLNFISTSLGNTAGRGETENMAMSSDLSAVNCNQTVSESFSNSNTVGNRSWTVQTSWTWTLNCDVQNNNASFDLNGNGSLDFDGPNLSKDITRTHDFNVTGIEPSSNEWTYNANHSRDGFIQSNVGNQNSMNTLLTYGSTDIVVSKATEMIVSGTFEIDFSATTSTGNSVTRGATVVFNGNQTATVTLDNGNTFDVNW